MKSAEQLAEELDLVHSQLEQPTGMEDLLLLLGQGVTAVLKELQMLNAKADEVLRRID